MCGKDIVLRFAVSITVFRVIVKVVIVLLVDHTEKFAVAVKDAACVNGNPMDIHLKRINTTARTPPFREAFFLFQHVIAKSGITSCLRGVCRCIQRFCRCTWGAVLPVHLPIWDRDLRRTVRHKPGCLRHRVHRARNRLRRSPRIHR